MRHGHPHLIAGPCSTTASRGRPDKEVPINRHPSVLGLSDLRNELLDGAECRFDPELHDGPDPVITIEHTDARAAREDVARDVCGSCPVRDACLEYAMRVAPKRGIWSGRTAEEITLLILSRHLLTGGIPRLGKSGHYVTAAREVA